jgi:crossover junction endodeoxyribonuclease RusA
MTCLHLPWPNPKLSPNARVHYHVLARVKKAYRADCRYFASHWEPDLPAEGPIPVRFVFRPPDRRVRDRDNMIAAFKAGCDGLADGLHVNDARFEPTYAVGEPHKGGMIEVWI